MSKGRYSEEEAVQKPAGELLRKMGWDLVYAYNDEELGQYGTLGRTSYREVVLRRYLVDAIVELNEWLEVEECEQAADTLMATLATDTLLQTNEKKYAMLRDGIPVEKRRADGTKYTEYAQVFDFEHPEYNRFIAVEEMWVEGPLYKRRPDLMGFVNGIPLLFVEFKRHDKDVRRAYEDNYTDYQDTIPQLFHFNAFVMLSNGLEAKVGTLGSKYEFFHEWKRLAEGMPGSVDPETMLHREFEKAPHKNLLVDDLRDAIERRLEVALRANPRRADYYERYQRIIDEYNREQDRATIEATFEALMKLSEELSEEEQRFVREGFTNERQLAVFDMLYKDTLTKSEIEQVKQLSRELVDKIQERVAQMVRWTEKPETRSDVKTLIRDELYQLLPQSYPDESILMYRDEIYEYFYSRAA